MKKVVEFEFSGHDERVRISQDKKNVLITIDSSDVEMTQAELQTFIDALANMSTWAYKHGVD